MNVLLVIMSMFLYQGSTLDDIIVNNSGDKPVLLYLGSSWCEGCVLFKKKIDSDNGFKQFIDENVNMVYIDFDKPEGKEYVERFKYIGIPGFTLLYKNKHYSWVGKKYFKTILEDLLDGKDPIERYTTYTDYTGVLRLAEVLDNCSRYVESVEKYKLAITMGADNNSTSKIWISTLETSVNSGDTLIAEYRRELDVLLSLDSWDTNDRFFLISRRIWNKTSDDDAMDSYGMLLLLDKTKIKDKKSLNYHLRKHRELSPDKLNIAIEWYKELENSEHDSTLINEFAWFCFENDVYLNNAVALARSYVPKATAGKNRAYVSDTVAELFGKLGNNAAALKYSKIALENLPNMEHMQQQVIRFSGE